MDTINLEKCSQCKLMIKIKNIYSDHRMIGKPSCLSATSPHFSLTSNAIGFHSLNRVWDCPVCTISCLSCFSLYSLWYLLQFIENSMFFLISLCILLYEFICIGYISHCDHQIHSKANPGREGLFGLMVWWQSSLLFSRSLDSCLRQWVT